MSSIFLQALGSDFARLHPKLQRRFSVNVADGVACVGTGVMDRIWHAAFARPFLALGGTRNVLVPIAGRNVPFRIENYPYVDSYGRETVTFVRTFHLPGRQRRFDATMVYDHQRSRIVDYLGSHQHIATDLDFWADEHGGLVIRSGDHRLHERWLSCRVPELLAGTAEVRESYDDEAGRFRIQVTVVNRRFGPLFGYSGTFTADYVDVAENGVPASVMPRREEMRT
ncbi:DUF4166 domain-containing protein [Microtetraspora sp. NBRC 16547]|uniref:DUF4166 domain-containing protein n=1 Tax=Microtetraspora sp. NBRC 16547 TaxID=3030993 RepID=UPI0024A2CAA1|nr:DUF4166 domain-containing protein [Microtetraspora sp. NBRC 16547]GLW96064.1 hypothetical protein Misp02_01510 [Microtetraspora sp. NBRC 16547]